MARRPFQIGPTTYRREYESTGWYIVAEWRVIDRRGDKEHLEEVVAGPFVTELEAHEAQTGMSRD